MDGNGWGDFTPGLTEQYQAIMIAHCYFANLKISMSAIRIALASLIASLFVAAAPAMAQQADIPSLPGAWKLVAVYDQFTDGRRRNNWGNEPQGLMIVTTNGLASVQIMAGGRAPRPGTVPTEQWVFDNSAFKSRVASDTIITTADPISDGFLSPSFASDQTHLADAVQLPSHHAKTFEPGGGVRYGT